MFDIGVLGRVPVVGGDGGGCVFLRHGYHLASRDDVTYDGTPRADGGSWDMVMPCFALVALAMDGGEFFRLGPATFGQRTVSIVMRLMTRRDVTMAPMRTTVTLAPDVAAAVERVRRERAVGVSEAVNELIRAGLRAKPVSRRLRQRTFKSGLRIDVSNVGEALEILEGPNRR